MKQSIRIALNVFLLTIVMLTLTAPAYAQDSDKAAQAAPGVGILIFLMGLAAIGLVGFVSMAQSRAAREPNSDAGEE